MKGIEMERSKKMYEAIQFYRRAVQLVPDIEFRLEESFKNKTRIDNEEDNQGILIHHVDFFLLFPCDFLLRLCKDYKTR